MAEDRPEDGVMRMCVGSTIRMSSFHSFYGAIRVLWLIATDMKSRHDALAIRLVSSDGERWQS